MKPPYRVPSMAEIAAVPSCGLTVASTFAGCGGSCLGYRMAGYKVLWANEFVEAARDTYRANYPDTPLDPRDIRQVQPEDVLAASGLAAGQLDLLDGSPPCASFSTAGKRQAGWGRVRAYSDTRQRTDDLFFEYVRLLRGLMPRAFLAENVSGLVKGVAKGYFKEILAALKESGYVVEARLLDAQWLGVPQMRQRILFQGVRADLGGKPAWPRPLPYRYSVREALGAGDVIQTFKGERSTDLPAPAVLTHVRASTRNELTFGAGAFRADRDRRGGFGAAGEITDQPAPSVLAETAGNFWIEEQHGFDGHRYLPPDAPMPTVGDDRPVRVLEAEADISRFAIGREWDRLRPGEASARYFNLVKPDADAPCPTVTLPAGGVSAASVTHPLERRKFTIAELKRVCAFPDDFVLTGTYAQQWERLGRAVPPLMMAAVARALRDHVLCPSLT